MSKVTLTVNGKGVPLNPQMQLVFAEVNAAMINTLKGIDGNPESFEITVKP